MPPLRSGRRPIRWIAGALPARTARGPRGEQTWPVPAAGRPVQEGPRGRAGHSSCGRCGSVPPPGPVKDAPACRRPKSRHRTPANGQRSVRVASAPIASPRPLAAPPGEGAAPSAERPGIRWTRSARPTPPRKADRERSPNCPGLALANRSCDQVAGSGQAVRSAFTDPNGRNIPRLPHHDPDPGNPRSEAHPDRYSSVASTPGTHKS